MIDLTARVFTLPTVKSRCTKANIVLKYTQWNNLEDIFKIDWIIMKSQAHFGYGSDLTP